MKILLSSKITSLVLTLLVLASGAHATDRYMSKTGAGLKNGTNWANAYSISTVQAVLNTTMVAGDTLYLEGGNYGASGASGLVINSSGTSIAKKSMIGVDLGAGLPLFYGTEATIGYTGLNIQAGSGYWTIKNLSFQRRDIGIGIYGNGHPGMLLENISVRQINSAGFQITDADGLVLQNCKAERYVKKGFAFPNSCDGVTIKNCYADFTGNGLVDDPAWRLAGADPLGFHFHIKYSTFPQNTNILMEDCETLNNNEDTATTDDYEQGDGFMFEGKNAGVTMRRCKSYRNQDGAYDMKGSNQVLEDCIGMSSRYGFKLWYSGNLTNCIAIGNWAYQLQHNGNTTPHTITATRCTFHCTASNFVGARVELAGNSLILNDCILSFAGAAGTYGSGTGITYNGTVQRANTAITTNEPKFNNPISPWNGIGNNYDNLTFGLTKGWNSTVVGGSAPLVNLDFETAGQFSSRFRNTFSGAGATTTQTANGAGNDYVQDNSTVANAGARIYVYDSTPADATTKSLFNGPMKIEGDIRAGTAVSSIGLLIVNSGNEAGAVHQLAHYNWDASGTNDRLRIFPAANITSDVVGTATYDSNSTGSSGSNAGDGLFVHVKLIYRADTVDPTRAVLNLTVGSATTGDVLLGANSYLATYEIAIRMYDAGTTATPTTDLDNLVITPN